MGLSRLTRVQKYQKPRHGQQKQDKRYCRVAPAKRPKSSSANVRSPLPWSFQATNPNASLLGVTVENYPLGYPKMGVYLESDDAFNMYRRFGLLHSRLLLHKQDQLRVMEDRLLALDKLDDHDEDGKIFLQCREDDDEREASPIGQTRQELFGKIQALLLEYGS